MTSRISICLPTLNARRFLEPRVASIFAQTLTDWELIVCDSFSDDGTWEYLQQFKNDPRVRLYQVPKEGLYAGWNECLRRCHGEYIYIATADDTCSPDLLEKMVGALESGERRAESVEGEGESVERRAKSVDGEGEKAEGEKLKAEMGDGGQKSVTYNAGDINHNEDSTAGGGRLNFRSQVSSLSPSSHRPVDICACRFYELDEYGKESLPRWEPLEKFYADGTPTRTHVRPGIDDFFLHGMLGPIWVTMTAVLFRRSLIEKCGMFPTNFGSAGDVAWAMNACAYSDMIWIPERLATWRRHPQQATSENKKTEQLAFGLKTVKHACRSQKQWVDRYDKNIDWQYFVERPGLMALFYSLGLSRVDLRKSPFRFMRNWFVALRIMPLVALTYAAKLFPYDFWHSPECGDPSDSIHWARQFSDLWHRQ